MSDRMRRGFAGRTIRTGKCCWFGLDGLDLPHALGGRVKIMAKRVAIQIS